VRSDVLAYVALEVAQALIAALAAAAHFRFHRQNPEQFLGLWGWSWLALATARFIGALGVLVAPQQGLLDPHQPVLSFVVQVTSYLAMLTLVAGAFALIRGRPLSTRWLVGVVGGGLLAGALPVAIPMFEATRFTVQFVVRTAAGALVCAVVGGWIWWCHRAAADLGPRATGLSIAAFSLPLLGYAWATSRGAGYSAELSLDGLVLAGIAHTVVSAAMAMSMIVWLVELERERGRAAERELHRELEARERRLALAERMESVGRLAGGVAHDFNNLLTVVKGNGALLQRALPSGSPEREWLDEIGQAADRGAGLIRQLLAFARRQPVEPRVFEVGELVTSVEPIVRRLLGENVALTVRLGEAPSWIRADPSRIEQVIMNLAANAKDAMAEGGRCDLAVANLVDPVSGLARVRLTFTDTGHGMTAEVQARVFEPFFSTKPPGFGTGLGLATAYGVIEQAGGTIMVDSEVGRGTTFTITMPATDPAPPPEPTNAARNSAGGTEWVMVVEDEAGVRRVASRALAGQGYRVVEAADGIEALDLLARTPQLACIVSDVVMPRLGGAQFARWLEQRYPEVPVIFTSGYTGSFVPPASSRTTFLQKPYTPDDLAAAVRRVIDRARFQ